MRSNSDTLEVIIAETASLPSGVMDGDKPCDDSFGSLEEDAQELENNETGLDHC